MKTRFAALNAFVRVGFNLKVLTIQHKYNSMLTGNVKIYGVALYVETVGALHIEIGPTFLRKHFKSHVLCESVQAKN